MIFLTDKTAKSKQKDVLRKAQGGAHSHELSSFSATAEDGQHMHIFQLPGGAFLWTEWDGAHRHGVNGDVAEKDISAHRHLVAFEDTTTVTTSDGEHEHSALDHVTSYDGLHTHQLTLGDGTVITSLTAAESRERMQELPTYSADSVQKTALVKSIEEKRIVYGVVLDPYVVDAHNDLIPPADVEAAAHEWIEKYRHIGKQHTELDTEAALVESFIVPYPSTEDYAAAMLQKDHSAYKMPYGDQTVHSGTWILGVRLSEERWELVKSGDVTGFSIAGFGAKKRIQTVDLPAVSFIDLP